MSPHNDWPLIKASKKLRQAIEKTISLNGLGLTLVRKHRNNLIKRYRHETRR